jgi:nucleotide-binding universal stress UspA family protein
VADWRRIGCAVDFSDPSRLALEEAAGLAGRLGSQLLLIHVVESAPSGPEPVFAPPPASHPAESAAAQLEAWAVEAGRLGRGSVRTATARGRAATEIARMAREEDLDLLVLGTHGRTGVRRLVLGSVAEETVRVAPCPVLVVRPPAR